MTLPWQAKSKRIASLQSENDELKKLIEQLKNPPPPPLKDNLSFAFRDGDGRVYYRFPESVAMPLVRLLKIQDFMAWMIRGLTADNIKEIAGRMDELLPKILSTGKGAAKMGLMISELTDRNERCVPVEIIYNYLACFYIREDEQPTVINDQVQKEKVLAFKKSAESGNMDDFFFHLPEYKNVSNVLSTTTNSWPNIVAESREQEERMERLMKISATES